MNVVLATIPERLHLLKANVERVFAQEGMRPFIFVIGDGVPEADLVEALGDARGKVDMLSGDAERKGAWFRHYSASYFFAADEPYCTIDDDYIIPPDYLAKSVPVLERADAFAWAVCQWGTSQPVWPRQELAEDVKSHHLWMGSFFVSETRLVRGLWKSPVAADFMRRGSHDEGLISWWLWLHGAKMIRPKGSMPIDDAPEQHAVHSMHQMYRGQLLEHNALLVHRYGWPGDPTLGPLPKPLVRGANHAKMKPLAPNVKPATSRPSLARK